MKKTCPEYYKKGITNSNTLSFSNHKKEKKNVHIKGKEQSDKTQNKPKQKS
jgi:hypothetical protein